MKIETVFEEDLYHAYAVLHLKADRREFVLFASEEEDACYAYDLDNDFKRIDVWQQIGGTMSLVQIGDSLDFLATQKFYPGFNARKCELIRGTFNGENWEISKVVDFPYLHRFDLIGHAETLLFVGCTICRSKVSVEDWSDPGEVFLGEFDVRTNELNKVEVLPLRLTKNHGYLRVGDYALVTGDEGIFKLTFPTSQQPYQLTQLFNQKVSDVALTDINQDGQPEYLTVEDFHGAKMLIYDADFKEIYRHDLPSDFGHVVWGGRLGSRNHFIFGPRAGNRDLILLSYEPTTGFSHQIIGKSVGASNIKVYEKEGRQFIAAANREISQVAIYELIEEEN